MEIRLSAHGAYHHQYHPVWIPKYRRRVLKGALKDFLAENLFFSSTVGLNEAVIQRYVEFQEKVDTGQLKLQLDFGFGSPVPRA